MNISKKILSVLLSVIMVISLVSITGHAEGYADYNELNALISRYEALDKTMYTDESFGAVEEVVNKIDLDLASSEQSVVDGWEDELETALSGLKYDLTKANANVLIDLSDKKLSAGDTLTVTVILTSNFYITNIQIPVIFDKTQFAVIGNVTNKSYYTPSPMFSERNYRFLGRADKADGFGKTSNPEKWNTDEAKSQYGYALISAAYDSSIGNDIETYARPQNDIFATFELEALVDVTNALESVFISADWAKSADNKTGLLVVGMTTSEYYDASAEAVNYANISYATSTVKHYYEEQVFEPTCTEGGYTKYSCTECDYSYMADYVDALGHVKASAVEENYIDEDCVNDGSYDKVVYCKNCGIELSRQHVSVPAYGHIDGDVETENLVQASCEKNGSYEKVVLCMLCGEEMSRETITISALGHNYKGNVTKPSCTEKGYTTYTCSKCNDVYVSDYVDALDHDYKTEVIAPTCTDEGYTVYTCTRCDNTYNSDFVEAKGHSDTEWHEINAPTCEEKGYEKLYCPACNSYIEKRTVDALGHDYKAVVTYPTCVEQGYTTYICEVCADKYITDYVDTIAHAFGDWEVSDEATCTADGKKIRLCVCGEKEEEIIPATGHLNIKEVVEKDNPATCETDGSYEKVIYCSDCDYEISRETIVVKATGHNYESVVTRPTYKDQGYTTHTCTGCGDSYRDNFTDILPDFELKGTVTSFGDVNEPVTITLTIEGETEPVHTITVSGNKAEYSFGYLKAMDYIMTVSKYNHAERVYDIMPMGDDIAIDAKIHLIGDITGDGKVNAIDVARVNAHSKGVIALSDYELICADVNSDDKVNAVDVARINGHAKGSKSLWTN